VKPQKNRYNLLTAIVMQLGIGGGFVVSSYAVDLEFVGLKLLTIVYGKNSVKETFWKINGQFKIISIELTRRMLRNLRSIRLVMNNQSILISGDILRLLEDRQQKSFRCLLHIF
jgi:hypothetical protein